MCNATPFCMRRIIFLEQEIAKKQPVNLLYTNTIEELCELIQAITKLQRFRWGDLVSQDDAMREELMENLIEEIGDVINVLNVLTNRLKISDNVQDGRFDKLVRWKGRIESNV